MPYIPEERRGARAETAGELNFLITDAIALYLEYKKFNYQVCNDVLGALEGAKQEFYRRVVAPYEDQAIERNGDVYPEELIKRLNSDD